MSTKITAPMPGTVQSIKVKKGDVVTSSQVLVLLQTLKNEVSVKADTGSKFEVVDVAASEGSNVSAGETLVVLKAI
ncbi:unnamed protein product [Ambrosiozyma monospora]|uniref:Unnamed protein product n=1 Tax=Ambrosiozyma monospora TaxID=43982 RepID=A0ACB5T8X7_AMBMO|nr:unnamed protein product [Ambrosiozyma monospora]